MSNPFIVGEKYTNNDIVRDFKCGNMGGMRKSNTLNALIIVSDHTKSLYDDKWYGDILHYTGMGKIGDQDLSSRQNKTLSDSNTNGIEVHLFEVLIPREYTYLGQVVLDTKPYKEIQKDDEGNERDVWMFPLKRLDNSAPLINELLEKNDDEKRKTARKLSMSKLKEYAERNESRKVSRRIVATNVYARDVYISEYAKRRANGICQLCNQVAPFNDSNGDPYLECHHIHWIANGGSDTIENTVALCPNCHRKIHALNLDSDIGILKSLESH